jgi:uncharacterized RDD family membrane protein YckC
MFIMEQQLQTSVQVASSGRRFMNYFLDSVFYEIGIVVITDPFARLIFGKSFTSNFWGNFLFASVVIFLYYFVFETLFQRTPAKFITGTKVIMVDGSKPGAGTIAKRSLSRLVPFEVFSMYTGELPENQGTWWHDRWNTTRVIRNKK